MSSTALFWVVLLVMAAGAGVFAWTARIKRRGRHDAERERLLGSTTQQLLSDLRIKLGRPGWERYSSVARIQGLGAAASDQDVLDAIGALWKEVVEKDASEKRSGRDSDEFNLYDSGVVIIMEVLEARVVRTKTL